MNGAATVMKNTSNPGKAESRNDSHRQNEFTQTHAYNSRIITGFMIQTQMTNLYVLGLKVLLLVVASYRR